MKKILPLIYLPIVMGCQQGISVQEVLDKHRAAIGDTESLSNLYTLSACEGPEGAYTTETHSSLGDDYLLFKQDYTYKDNPFYAAIYTKSKGQGLDTLLQPRGALSEVVIAILKAHEFHELMLQVGDRYFEMDLAGDTVFFDTKCWQIQAVDHLSYPVKLFFNKRTGLMEGFSHVNAFNKNEVIQVHFEDWETVKDLNLFKKVMIKQGDLKKYYFDFQNIEWNSDRFKKLEIPS